MTAPPASHPVASPREVESPVETSVETSGETSGETSPSPAAVATDRRGGSALDVAEAIREQLRDRQTPTWDGVSVLMTTYNAMPHLPAAVDSILGQTHRQLQLVIVDDGSTDSTASYLDSVCDRRIEVIRQPNAGTAAAANFGLLRCHGRVIARMDADDIAEPQRLRLQLAFLDRHPDVVMVGTRFRYFGDASIGPMMRLPLGHDAIVQRLRRGHHALAHGTVMCRSDSMLRLGGYWGHPFFEDWDLFLRMGRSGRLANLAEPLYRYRAVAGSLSSRRTAAMHLHYRFAIESDRCRRAGEPEPAWNDFAADGSTGPAARVAGRLDDLAMTQYRQSLAHRYAGRRFRAASLLAVAALLNPSRTARRLIRRMGD